MVINLQQNGSMFRPLRVPICCIAAIIALPLIHNSAYAQGKWKHGYLVTNGNDTLRGRIAYVEKTKCPKRVEFIAQHDRVKHTYRPGEIKMFEVDGPNQKFYFKTAKARLDLSVETADFATQHQEPELKERLFFAQLLADGPRALYFYQDTNVLKKHYLIEFPKDTFVDLAHKLYYDSFEVYGNRYRSYDYSHLYKRQLARIFAACNGKPDTNDLQYSAKTLIPYVRRMNTDCGGASGSEYSYKADRTLLQWGVEAGAANTAFAENGDPQGTFGTKFQSYSGAELGLYAGFVAPNTEKRGWAELELLYDSYHTSSEKIANFLGDRRSYADMAYLRSQISFRYIYPYLKVKPYLLAGFSFGFATRMHVYSQIESNWINPNTQQIAVPARNLEMGYYMGFGAMLHQFALELRYVKANGFLGTQAFGINTDKVMVLLRYNINKSAY